MNSLFNPPFFTAFFQGKIATGAKMFFYETETLTPIEIFDDSGDPLPNPISADLFGQFVPIYIGDDVAEYRVQLQTATGSVIDDVDPSQNYQALIDALSAEVTLLEKIVGVNTRSVEYFGAVPDGTSDATAAFNAAIAWANGLSGGATILVPGRYAVPSQLDSVTNDHVKFKGLSNGGSAVILSANTYTFWWDGVYGGGFDDILIDYDSSPGSSAIVALLTDTSDVSFNNIFLVKYNTFLELGTAGHGAFGTFVNNVEGQTYNSGKRSYYLVAGDGLFINNVATSVIGVTTPAIDRTSTLSTVPGTYFVELAAGSSWDTLIATNLFLERFDQAFNIKTSSGAIFQNLFVDQNSVFDFHKSDVFHLESSDASAGGIFGCNIAGYQGSWEGRCISITGPGHNEGHILNAVEALYSGGAGIFIDGALTKNIRVSDPIVSQNDRLNGSESYAIYINASDVIVNGGQSGVNSVGVSFPWQADYGVGVGADLTGVQVQNHQATGGVKNWQTASNTFGDPNRSIRNNLSADYAGLFDSGSDPFYTLPASGSTWTNSTYHDVQFIFSGLLALSYQGGGTGLTQGVITLVPGDFIVPFYSGTPAYFYRVMP